MCKLGVLELENSLVTKHNQGGVLMWGLKDNRSKIARSAIEGNGVSINVVGKEFRVKL